MVEQSHRDKGADMGKVERVASQMHRPATYGDVSEIFRVLGDSTRVRILDAVSREELCVCDISAVLRMRPSAVSHHLRTLRNLKLVRHRRDGKKVYYTLGDGHVTALLTQALDHVSHG